MGLTSRRKKLRESQQVVVDLIQNTPSATEAERAATEEASPSKAKGKS